MSDVQINRCKYLLPCGICDKTNKPCSENEPIVAYRCEHVWELYSTTTNNDGICEAHQCLKCGKFKYRYYQYINNTKLTE